MATVGAIGASAFSPQGTPRRDSDEPRVAPATSQSRALVAITPPAKSERQAVSLKRPLAPFLAQLIATETGAPQTRARRRAEPEEAIALYSAAARSFALRRAEPIRRT